MPTPLSLTDTQLNMIMQAAEPLLPVDRSAFLVAVANYLSNEPVIGDGAVGRAIRSLQREFFKPPMTIGDEPRHNSRNRRADRVSRPRAHESPIAFVVSRNEKRIHESESQRGISSARALPFYEAEAKLRQAKAGERGKEGGRGKAKPSAPIGAKGKGHRARDDAARDFGTTPRTVQRGKEGGRGRKGSGPIGPEPIVHRARDDAARDFGTADRSRDRNPVRAEIRRWVAGAKLRADDRRAVA